MTTLAGSAHSTNGNTTIATRDVISKASARLNGRTPSLAVVFATPEHPLDKVLGQLKTSLGCPALGCTSGGPLTDQGASMGPGLALLLIAADDWVVDMAMAQGLNASPGQATRKLCAGYGRAAETAAQKSLSQCTSLILVEAYGTSAAEAMVRDFMTRTRPFQQMVGGAAADHLTFDKRRVGMNGEVAGDAAVVAHVFGSKRWGLGLAHGLSPATKPMVVTRSSGARVHSLDDKSALGVYQDFARGAGERIGPGGANSFLYQHNLGLYMLDELRSARAPMTLHEDGAVDFAADVPQGSRCCILSGDGESMLRATTEAAREARENLGGREAAGLLVFDCLARGQILGPQVTRMVAAIRQVFPNVPMAGFFTYGEIARYKGRIEGWHNCTIVIAAIPA